MTTETVTGFRHTDLGEYTAEASDLGWPPGHWPSSFTAVIGDKTFYVRAPVPMHDREGDLVKVRYYATTRPMGGNPDEEDPRGNSGATFIVWND
jgi:hypothetical protein